MNNVVSDNDADNNSTNMGAQGDLFPEGDSPAGADVGAIVQQIASIQPDQLAQVAAALDPDVRANLAQALYASMSPDERAAVDTTPGADVQQQMNDATPQRPEQQYQMSITAAQKRMAKADGMGALADDHLSKWSDRINSLHEDGYLSDADKDKMLARFDKKGEFRFSIILDNRGHLHDDCVAIEALEKARSQSATLSRSVISTRFGVARPAVPPKGDKMGMDFDPKAAEEVGSRLGRSY